MRLSEFKDEKAIKVVADLMVPLGDIATDPECRPKNGENRLAFATKLLSNHSKEVMNILAILDDKDPKSYHCTAASVLKDVMEMITDPELMELFGFQSKTSGSSGSASETTEAPNK